MKEFDGALYKEKERKDMKSSCSLCPIHHAGGVLLRPVITQGACLNTLENVFYAQSLFIVQRRHTGQYLALEKFKRRAAAG